MSTETKVARPPECDVCKQEGRKTWAYADAKLNIGPWANVCADHFAAYGCTLGTGRGQRLVVESGYSELTMIANGVVYDTFASEDREEVEKRFQAWKAEYADEPDDIQIWLDGHDHPLGADCECAQYHQTHTPAWTNQSR